MTAGLGDGAVLRDETEDFLVRLLDETRDEIERADMKASILLAAMGIAVATLIGALLAADVRADSVGLLVWAFGIVSCAALSLSVGLLGAAVMPRLGRAVPGRARYFMDHAQYDDIDELRLAIDEEASHPATRDLGQLRDLARLVRTKYRLSMMGEWTAGIGLLTSALTALAYFVARP